MMTITVRELLKNIVNCDMDTGVYIQHGEQGDCVVKGIKEIGFDDDGDIFLIAYETE